MDYYGEGKDKTISLRITADMFARVDALCSDSGGWRRMSRGEWIRDAITEKLQRAGEKANGDGDQYVSFKDLVDQEKANLE